MPMTNDVWAAATAAVLQYFQGERREMLAILAVSLAVASASAWLYVIAGDGFAKGLMVAVLVSAALLSGTAASLLVRDSALSKELISATPSTQAETALAAERRRIENVISKYKLYRYAACLIGALAFAALLISQQAWLHGVAAALLLLVVAQVTIDHYSERRAHLYLMALRGVAFR